MAKLFFQIIEQSDESISDGFLPFFCDDARGYRP